MLYFTAFEAMKNFSMSRGASTPIANGMAGAAGCFIGHFSFSFSCLNLLEGIVMRGYRLTSRHYP
jgi:hypothetical protein